MYNAENYRKVKEEYNLKRNNAMADADKRKREIWAISPEIKQIDAALSKTGLKIFGIACTGADVESRVNDLRRESEAMLEDRREILNMLGYPADYTDIHYECDECKDTGYVDTKMCDCMRKRLIKRGFMTSGLGFLIEKQNFDNLKTSYYGKNEAAMRNNISYFKEYARSFSENSENLLLLGGTGLGKTHIASAIAKVVIENGNDVFYESALNLIVDFDVEHFGRETAGVRTDKYFDCDLLIIDDLGAEKSTQLTQMYIYNVINTRLNRGKPTVISTNLNENELQNAYDSRITSRLFGCYTPFLFDGEDTRIQKI